MRSRHCYLFVIVSVLILSFLGNPLEAAQRKVLIEGFTNTSCGPCAGWNPTERTILNAFGEDTVIVIKYHVNWPGSTDPMYLWNATEQAQRWGYYGVNAVPDARGDGSTTLGQNATTLRNFVRNRFAVSSPCTIEAEAHTAGETSVEFNATITPEVTVAGTTIKAFAVLITDLLTYASAPGTNGETIFPHVFRDMAPGTAGQAITLTAGVPVTFSGTLNRSAAWNPNDLSVIIFVQKYDGNKEMYQSTKVDVQQLWGMDMSGSGPRQLIVDPSAGYTNYTVNIHNIGTMDDIYRVKLEGALPTGWLRTVEAPSVNPSSDSIDVPVPHGQTVVVTARLNPNGVGGGAAMTISVNSTNATYPVEGAETFRLMSDLDVLLVDDDDSTSFESWYENSLTATAGDQLWGRWDLSMDSLSSTYLQNISTIIWFTGNSFISGTTLTDNDQAKLTAFLNRGGNLLLSGQGLGFDIRTDPFFTNYLHARYDRNYPQGVACTGINNDVLGNGMTFELTGGDGAANQSRQSALMALDDTAKVFLDYDGGTTIRHAALHATNGYFKVVYLGFGFEAISTEANRNELMQRCLDWFDGTIIDPVTDPRTPIAPIEFALGQNYPNPFNPETVIPYSLPARADVTLRVFDILGQEVAVLESGTKDAGYHSVVWNATNVSSGVYFCKFEAVSKTQTFRSTGKLVVLK